MADSFKLRMGSPFTGGSQGTNGVDYSHHTIDATNDAVEFVFQSETTDAITHLGVRWQTVGATPGTFQISLQSLSGSPLVPSGTVLGGGSPASVSFTPSGTGMKWYALDNPYTPTRGELIALVCKCTSYGSNTSSITYALNNVREVSLPKAYTNNAGARTLSMRAFGMGYKTASRVYGFPADALTTVTFDSGTTPDECGLWFKLPTTFCYSYKVAGIRAQMATYNSAENVVINLYTGSAADPDPATATVTISMAAPTATGGRTNEFMFTDATLPTLYAGTEYRIAFQPAATGADVSLYRIDQPSGESANWEAYDGGTWFKYTSRVNGGDFAEDADKRPCIDLIISDVTQRAHTLTGGMQA